MMDVETIWPQLRRLFADAIGSSLHYSIASIGPDGLPHLTPIGSLLLCEPGKAVYFEKFTRRMPQNMASNPNICVLAVRSGLLFWLSSLIRGQFKQPPAIRLYGVAGATRAATPEELRRWRKRVRALRFTKGHRLMWSDMANVRELSFTRAEGVHLGAMTHLCWSDWR